MVQKARRGKTYADCSRIVRKKIMDLTFDLLRERQVVRCLSMSEQAVRKWTSSTGVFRWVWDQRPLQAGRA
jgi:hypothetical protein